MATELDPAGAHRSLLSPGRWWEEYRHKLPASYLELIAAEANAARILHFHPIVVPGLLQTRDYAAAVTSATMLYPITSHDVELYVEARMRRQREAFDGSGSARMVFLLEEVAIRRPVGTRTIMRRQLDHLIEMTDHPTVTIVILPAHAPPHPGLAGAFMLIRHADPRIDDLLFLEGPHGNSVVRDRPDLNTAYGRLADRLTDSGSSDNAAAAVVRSIRADIMAW